MANSRKKVKVLGTKQYIDNETGELVDMNVVTVEERDANFHKIWLGHIIQALDMLGNQKIKVLNFILSNLDRENQLIMTLRKIAEKSGISYATVAETMKALQDADFLVKINSGAYKVNPDKIFKGGKGDRLRVLLDYTKVKEEVIGDNELKEKASEPSLKELEEAGQTSILNDNDEQAAAIEPEVPKEPVENKKICPECGSPMKIKTGYKGEFWGCTAFPKCKHSDDINKGA